VSQIFVALIFGRIKIADTRQRFAIGNHQPNVSHHEFFVCPEVASNRLALGFPNNPTRHYSEIKQPEKQANARNP
jgi:hypothetical protein